MFARINEIKKREIEVRTELLNKRRKISNQTLVDRWFTCVPIESLSEEYGSSPRTITARVKESVAEMVLDNKDSAFDAVILLGYSESLRNLIELRSRLQNKYKRYFQVVAGDAAVDLEEDTSDKQEIIKVNDAINRTLNLMSIMRAKASGRAVRPDERKDLIAQIVAALGGLIVDMNKDKSINRLL